MSATAPILELRKATKEYAASRRSRTSTSRCARRGPALLGENGAGKSTLTKMMAGVVNPTSGEMLIDGRSVNCATPAEALAAGIAMVFQETSLVPSMTVAQNIYLGHENFFNRLRGIYIAAQQFLQSLQLPRRSDRDGRHARRRPEADGRDRARRAAQRPGHHLRRADRDADARGEAPFLRPDRAAEARGVSIIFITHALEEALQIADRITVLRDGEHVVTDDDAQLRPRDDRPRHGRPRPCRRRSTAQRKTAACGRRAGAC